MKFKLTPQAKDVGILNTLKDQKVKWSLTSDKGKFSVKYEKTSAEFDSFEESIDWLKEQFKNVRITT